jgi:hypothetical protein
MKSINKWYQLTFRYVLENGEVAYHLLERHEKAKGFKFVKFYL